MYSKYNEEKSVIAEKFIITLKNQIFKHMTAILNNVYFDVLDDTVNKVTVTDSYAECNEDFNEREPKFKVGDHVRISKY